LTDALGRQVKVGNLTLSLLSGGVKADQISIADDPTFSQTPFVQAKSLKVGVEMMPLIFSRTLNVTDLTLDQPEINLVKSENGEKWNFSSLGAKGGPSNAAPSQSKPGASETKPANEPKKAAAPATKEPSSSSASINPNLSVAKLNVTNGRLTVSRAGTEKQHVYDKVDISVSDFSFTSSFPFKMTANLPGGGSLNLDGKAGPIDANDASLTPLDAKITVKNMKLEQSGFIDPASGISGTANLDGTLVSDGQEAKLDGTLGATGLKVVQKGSPAGRPVDVTFALAHNLKKEVGTITRGDIAMGKAVAHLTGTYDVHGKVTTVNLKLIGQGMPVDELEAMLPAVGVVLPPKATLKGGDVNINLASTGPVDKLVTTGSVQMQNTALANFNLGQKLSAISALSGKQTGNDTTIQNFSSDVRMAPEGTEAKNVNLNVPSIGVLTGAGTVNPQNQLAFKMNAAVGGMGIPFAIEGTTSDPKFVPDVKGLATGFLQNALQGNKGNTNQQNPINNVMGLFKKKQK
jgi:AsmA protein